MKISKKFALVAPCLLLTSAASVASAPKIFPLPQGVLIGQISDNGRWGLSQNDGETEGGVLYSAGGAVWNLSDMSSADVKLPSSGIASVNDITDDGRTVVGSCDNMPAFYDTQTGLWSTLPLPDGTIAGGLLAVTPDGTRAVGYANVVSDWTAVPVAYELESGKMLTLKNLPQIDMNHEVSEINRFAAISADGRYIVGRLSEHILTPVSMCAYVYDTVTDTYDFIGFTPNDTRAWTPDYKHCYFINDVVMSPNGKYVTGSSYVIHEIEGQEYLNEYYTAYKYDVASKTCDIFDGDYDSDVAGFAIDDNGTTFVSVPAVNPYASMAVRRGNYYYALDDIFRQAYGLDFYAMTGYSNTGKPLAVSADGTTFAMLVSSAESYVLKVDEPWADICSRVNLLSGYSAAPASGSVFSELNEVVLTFTRNIDLSGAASRIQLLDSDGKVLQTASAAEAKGSTLAITFRGYELQADKTYTVRIPANLITMTGDAFVASGEILLQYTGRRSGPVSATSIFPTDGSAFSRLDASTNVISMSFDASVKIADGAKGQLWRVGESEPFADLSLSLYNPTTLLVYPPYREFLYDGTEYKVVLPAGSVTDLSGNGPNEEITLHYTGNYVREVSADDKYLFSDDCQDYSGFMFYDGDRLEPGSVAASWGFTAANPWCLVHDNEESTDMALAAHSMFAAGGKADDWAVTPQLFIPDNRCYVSFDAQSYLKGKTDVLKVYAYVCDKGYSTLTEAIVNDIRENGKLIFAEQLSPGDSEESLDGEWTNYVVNLDEYAGKNIYLAFVNDNENQSAVILNHVEVVHDLQYLTTITSPSSVIKAESAPIEGIITLTSDILTVNSVDIKLKNSAGEAVGTFCQSDLDLTKGQTIKFAFDKQLPLQPGVVNRYALEITINGSETSTFNASIKNLQFAPTRRVVIEEYSGRACANCPLGFLAMENLERTFPGSIIPVVIRTYESDPLGSGLESYTSFIGLDLIGAPSGVVNRTVAGFPMMSVGDDYRFSGVNADGEGNDQVLWLDAVSSLMQSAPDADIDFTAVYDDSTGDIDIDGNTRFAINSSVNVALFSVLLEHKCATKQSNNYYTSTDPDLGEWGAGGSLGKSRVDITIDNVARQVYGTTFNGTPGMVPTVQNAAESNPFSFTVSKSDNISNIYNMSLVIMMIDTDTDQVINANVVPVSVINASISELESELTDAPVEYYNLQGRRVVNPAKGQLLIQRQGSKVSKIIY